MIYQLFLILSVFILLYSLFAKRIEKTSVSGPVIAILVGLLTGPLLLNLFDIKIERENYKVIAELALALVLFSDASKTNLKVLESNVSIPTRLLLIGLPITIVFGIAGGLLLFKEYSLLELGILATILAPTDAALGKAVVTNPKVPLKIREALNVESGLNDGICVPVLFLLLAFISAETESSISSFYGLKLFAREIGIGLAAGIVITYIGDWLAHFSAKREWISESWKPVVIIALSFSCFMGAQIAGGSGFIACFAGGFLYGVINKKHKLSMNLLESAEGAGDTLSLITWFIFGSYVIATFVPELTWEVVLYAVLSLTIIRIIPVFLSLLKIDISWKEKLFMGWFGPRGLASIVFAIIALDYQLPHKSTIIITVACTILLSVILHGFTAKYFTELLKKKEQIQIKS